MRARSRPGPSAASPVQLSASAAARRRLCRRRGGTALVTGATFVERAEPAPPFEVRREFEEQGAAEVADCAEAADDQPCVLSAMSGASFQLPDDLPTALTGRASMLRPPFAERRRAEAGGDTVIALDLIDREVGIGAVPEAADRPAGQRPGLELPAVLGAVVDQEAGASESRPRSPRRASGRHAPSR